MKEEVKFTAKERRFIEEYMVDFNATQAAIRAGYSAKTAYSIGSRLLKNVEVKSEIENRLKEMQLDAEGTISIVSKIAKSNANKYLKTVKVKRDTIVQRHLSEFIVDLKKEIAFESNYAVLAELNKDERKQHEAAQTKRERQIIRYQLELNENPDATRDYPGEPEEVEVTEFDLVALAKDKENGIIKSFKMTKDGPQVEFCSIDANLTNLLRVHGKFDDKLDIKTDGESLNRKVTPDEAKEMLDRLNSGKGI